MARTNFPENQAQGRDGWLQDSPVTRQCQFLVVKGWLGIGAEVNAKEMERRDSGNQIRFSLSLTCPSLQNVIIVHSIN